MSDLSTVVLRIAKAEKRPTSEFIRKIQRHKHGLKIARIYLRYINKPGAGYLKDYLKQCMQENIVPKQLGNDKVVKICNKFRGNTRRLVVHSLIRTDEYQEGMVLKTAELIKYYRSHSPQFYKAISYSAGQTKERYEDILDMYLMFKGIDGDISAKINNYNVKKLDFANFMQFEDDVLKYYKGGWFAEGHLISPLAEYRYKIKKRGFRRNLAQNNLGYIKAAIDTINVIHEERNDADRGQIKQGFTQRCTEQLIREGLIRIKLGCLEDIAMK